MNKNLIIGGIVVLVLIVGGGVFLMNRPSEAVSVEPTPVPAMEDMTFETPAPSAMVSTPGATETPSTSSGVVALTVEGANFKFTPATLKVKKGDRVKLTFKNTGGNHNFVIDEFDVKTQQIGSDEQTLVEFVANKVGTFEYYCSVGTHRAMGMTGTLTVE